MSMDDNTRIFYRANRLEDGVIEFGTILPANPYLKKPCRIVDCFEEAEYECVEIKHSVGRKKW